jgi:hypothetical protein
MASSSIAAMEDTFPSGFLEALTHLERDPANLVLLVMGDVPLAATFAPLIDEPPASFGVALLLAARGAGDRVSLQLAPLTGERARTAWPPALEFLRWLLAGEQRVALDTPSRRWIFERL